jgi:hypothetical protein
MRAFAEAWNDRDEFVQTVSAQISWSHNVALLDRLENPGLREWYAARAVRHGWSLAVLEHQIASKLHEREGPASNNLEARLPGEGSDLAREVAKDPLVLDFLGLSAEADETACGAHSVPKASSAGKIAEGRVSRRSTGRAPASDLAGVTIQTVKELWGIFSSIARRKSAVTVGRSWPPGRNWKPGQNVPSSMKTRTSWRITGSGSSMSSERRRRTCPREGSVNSALIPSQV